MGDGRIEPSLGPGGAPPPAAEVTRLEFHGSVGEFMPIVLVNILFTILTIGVFRFWARARVRRYLWSRTSLHGDSFEYTGTGLELFLGFLFVFLLIILPAVGLYYLANYLISTGQAGLGGVLLFVLYIGFLFLFGAAIYRAGRYRMSRTRWRGIRGNQRGKGWAFAGRYLLLIALQVVTFGLALPFFLNNVWSYTYNRREFGTGRFCYTGKTDPLYPRFLACVALAFVVLFFVFFLIGVLLALLAATVNLDQLIEPDGTFSTMQIVIFTLFALASYVIVGITMGAVFLLFYQRYFSHIARFTEFEGAGFRFEVGLGRLFRLWFGNLMILIFTLGLGHPFTQLRIVRFIAEHLELVGTVDWDRIEQTSADAPGVGEGLADAFDLGTV